MGGEKAREALLGGARQSNARVRRACLQALGSLPADRNIAEFAAEILRNGDPSYGVCGAAMMTYVKHKGKDPSAILSPWLIRPSHNDTLRAAALEALAQTQDLAVLEPLLRHARAGNPRSSRGAALRGLIQLAKAKLNAEQSKQIQTVLVDSLQSDDRMVQAVVLNAVTDLGPMASSLLPAVEKVSRDAANERVRELAKRTAERIRSQDRTASATPASAEVKQLREKVERLEREQSDLRDRLRKMEQKAAQSSSH
jgi:aminopeptidase N